MALIYVLFVFTIFSQKNIVGAHFDLNVPHYKNVFDLNLYESALDPLLCEEQIKFIQENDQELLLEFMDAGIRTPRGVFAGNLLDLGNYHQCLGIDQPIPNSVIEGKYCMIELPLNQSWPSLPSIPEWPEGWPEGWPESWPEGWPELPWPASNPQTTRKREEMVKRLQEYYLRTSAVRTLDGGRSDTRISKDNPLVALNFRLAVCIPKVCSTHKALSSLFNNSETGLINFEESYCRLPNDKQWVAGDYVAVSIFSFIGLLVVLSTSYDLHHHYYHQKDPKKSKPINKLYLAFSAFTNTRRLVTYTPVPGTIECLDGIRSFAMMWVILGHTFATLSSSGVLANPLDSLNWMTSFKSVWIMAAPITVDTFFMLSGLLLVYTSAGKMSSMKLLKNLHLFYLNRLLRMFPVLAAMVLLQVSVLNRVTDGPFWNVTVTNVDRCRVYWWSTLLHIQNYLNPEHMCLSHSWYLAIDVQLHIISPIVLFWVLSGKRRLAWSALVGAMIAILAASTTYNFIMKFPSAALVPSRPQDLTYYVNNYYVNTLTRASPFFVGLIFGYILHLNRGQKVYISKLPAAIMWCCATVISMLSVCSSYPIMQLDWDNQLADSMINSFMRPAWAMAIGWLIFACVHGYSGPINWLLTLRVWKVLGRLSYAMYIVHYPIMFIVNAMALAPIYFSVEFSMFRFLADFTLAVLVAFLMTIFIDAPCSILIKHFMGGGPKKPSPKVEEKEAIQEKQPEP